VPFVQFESYEAQLERFQQEFYELVEQLQETSMSKVLVKTSDIAAFFDRARTSAQKAESPTV